MGDLQPASEDLAGACGIAKGMRVLDVGIGTGNFACAAARQGGVVHAVDISQAMLEMASVRAAQEGLAIDLVPGDAGDLPFPDDSFDVVASVFGVMFAYDPDEAISELVRVVRPGGRIALANYCRDGFIGAFGTLFERLEDGAWSPFE